MISFQPLQQEDSSLMHMWFNRPHVQQFYSLRSWQEMEVLEKLKPSLSSEKQLLGFIVRLGDIAIGYIQHYPVKDHPWAGQDLEEEILSKACGIDLFIGEEKWIHKGLGREIVNTFLETKVWPHFSYCVVDPDIHNTISIRMFQKCGFSLHKTVQAVNKLGKSSDLCLMVKEREVLSAV